jgi:hypothetical protein
MQRCLRCQKSVTPSSGLLVVNEDFPSEFFTLCRHDTLAILSEMTKDLSCLVTALREASPESPEKTRKFRRPGNAARDARETAEAQNINLDLVDWGLAMAAEPVVPQHPLGYIPPDDEA